MELTEIKYKMDLTELKYDRKFWKELLKEQNIFNKTTDYNITIHYNGYAGDTINLGKGEGGYIFLDIKLLPHCDMLELKMNIKGGDNSRKRFLPLMDVIEVYMDMNSDIYE